MVGLEGEVIIHGSHQRKGVCAATQTVRRRREAGSESIAPVSIFLGQRALA